MIISGEQLTAPLGWRGERGGERELSLASNGQAWYKKNSLKCEIKVENKGLAQLKGHKCLGSWMVNNGNVSKKSEEEQEKQTIIFGFFRSNINLNLKIRLLKNLHLLSSRIWKQNMDIQQSYKRKTSCLWNVVLKGNFENKLDWECNQQKSVRNNWTSESFSQLNDKKKNEICWPHYEGIIQVLGKACFGRYNWWKGG